MQTVASISVLLLTIFATVYSATETITATIYADNYFEFYVDGTLVKQDPLSFTPHNAVKFTFTVTSGASRTYAIKANDFATSSGYEYVNSSTPQLGDGALRMLLSDGTVSNKNWKCFTTSFGPTDASIAAGCSATNLNACALSSTTEPTGWTTSSFNDTAWSNATLYTEAEAGWGMTPSYTNGMCGPLTSPYTRLNLSPSSVATLADDCLSPKDLSWGSSSFIWQGDLKRDNTILCRFVFTGTGSSDSSSVRVSGFVILIAFLITYMFY
jgi:hypothetical protein